jgi:catechol 2,3-dioxygenase-like lactoylglutathione lyase family enzyme
MSVQLNHTIVHVRDKAVSAAFLADILGLPAPIPFGPFLTVQLDNDVTLDFIEAGGEFLRTHYAFLVSEKEFDEILGRIKTRGLLFWADPSHQQANRINTRDGRRGAYFADPDGHNLEILTRPYGSGG